MTSPLFSDPEMAEVAKALVLETADALATGVDDRELLAKLYHSMLNVPAISVVDATATAANVIIEAAKIIMDLVPGMEDEAPYGTR